MDIRQRRDRPTNSSILQYTGTGARELDFESYIYGYPEGTFFVVPHDEVPLPEDLEELALGANINIEALPQVPRLKEAVIDALLAEAMVGAPELLGNLAHPPVEWSDWDLREMERKHAIADARVNEVVSLVERDLRLRIAGLVNGQAKAVVVEATLPPPPVSVYDFSAEPVVVTADCPPPVAAEPSGESDDSVTSPEGRQAESAESGVEVEVEEEEDVDLRPGSKTVDRALQAVTAAREAELAQRLPAGARRRLRKMMPGRYLAYGEAMDSRADLCAAMTDARAMGRKNREVTVIDWDGEWPVVVRRYGKGGRTIYKVESALRRAGVEV